MRQFEAIHRVVLIMKTILTLLCLTGLYLSLPAQNFIRAYSEIPFSSPNPGLSIPFDAIQLPDGRYVFSATPAIIAVTQPNGEPQSTFTLLKPGVTSPSLTNIQRLADAGNNQIYLAGVTDVDTLFIMKLNLSGTIVWQKSIVQTGHNLFQLTATADGGLIALSSISRGSSQNAIPILSKLDANGNLQWQKRYFNSGINTGRLLLRDVSQTANGDYLITGATFLSGQAARVFVARLNGSGVPVWAKEFSSTNNSNEFGFRIQEITGGNLKLIVSSPAPAVPVGIANLSAQGNLSGAQAYTGINGDFTDAEIQPGGSIIAGVGNEGTGVKIAADGTPVFAKDYTAVPGSFTLMSAAFEANDGGTAFYAGYTFSLFGDFTPILYKTAALGTTPSGYSSDLTLNTVAYAPTAATATLIDSTVSNLSSFAATLVPAAVIFDTLFAVPTRLGGLRDREAALAAFPNPATDVVAVQGAGLTGEVVLHDAFGRIVARTLAQDERATLEVSTLPAGVYYARRAGDTGSRATRVVIVR
jgi:hypothetical protein